MGCTVALDTFIVLNTLYWHISTPYTALIKQILDNYKLIIILSKETAYIWLSKGIKGISSITGLTCTIAKDRETVKKLFLDK